MKDRRSQILELERLSKTLDPTPETFLNWMSETQKQASQFLETLPSAQAHVPFNPDEPGQLRFLHERLKSAHPSLYSENIKALFEILLSSGLDTAGSRYFGFIPGGGVPTGALADFTAALTNRYAGIFQASPGAVYLENEVIRTFIDWIGYPASAWGTLTSGGTLGNLTALLAARETRPRSEWEVSTLYLSEQAHHSILLSLKVAGFNLNRIRKIKTRSDFSLDARDLKACIQQDFSKGLKPWIIISSFGTTNTGSVDSLAELVEIRDEYGLWLHVDAAYGGFFVLTETGRDLFQKGAQADSIVLDPHKGLFMPYGTGAVLVRDRKDLRRPFEFDAAYLADLNQAFEKSPADYSPELTRPLRGARIYLSLKTFGLEAFRAALNEKLELTQYAYSRLQEFSELEFACPPRLTVIPFRVQGPDDQQTERLLKKILSRQKIYLSSTRLNGALYLRLCILSFRSHLLEVDLAIHEIRESLT
jgi:aromatic-L-amino-acid decarboxylase